MARTGTAEEVAQAVLWLCSDQSSFITGAVIPIDGGQLAGNKPPQMYRPGQPMEPGPGEMARAEPGMTPGGQSPGHTMPSWPDLAVPAAPPSPRPWRPPSPCSPPGAAAARPSRPSPGKPAASHSAAAGLAVGAQRKALAARYLAVAQAGNKRLEVEFDRLREADRHPPRRGPPGSARDRRHGAAVRPAAAGHRLPGGDASGSPGSCTGSTRPGPA